MRISRRRQTALRGQARSRSPVADATRRADRALATLLYFPRSIVKIDGTKIGAMDLLFEAIVPAKWTGLREEVIAVALGVARSEFK